MLHRNRSIPASNRRVYGGTALVALLVMGLSFVPGTSSFAADEYYKGKTLTVMIGSRAGGGTDNTGRLIARFWGNHIPGNPKVLVRNKPLQVLAGNDLHNRVRPDGLTVGVFAGGGSIGPVARKSKSVRYDPRQWGYVGSIERGATILMVRKTAYDRLMNRKAKPVAMGSVSTDRPQDSMAVFGSEYLGWNLKFVLGYPSSNQMYLAFERGEIDMFGSGSRKNLKRFLDGGVAVPLAAEVPRPDYPKVLPFIKVLGDKKPTGKAWKAFKAWTGGSAVDKYFAVSPKTSKKLLNILRVSFKATTKDPGFDKQARNSMGTGYAVLSGPETRDVIMGALEIPPEAIGVMQTLRAKYGLPAIGSKKLKTVKTTLAAVKRGGRRLEIKVGGKTVKLRVSGSRTEIMIGGQLSPRSKLKVGMNCEISYPAKSNKKVAGAITCK
jgi:tripartite-type tricarboxylate transporter receptor subunit TctC